MPACARSCRASRRIPGTRCACRWTGTRCRRIGSRPICCGQSHTPLVLLGTIVHNAVMPQTSRQLEARLESVERELAELKAAGTRKRGKRWYREIVGAFAGDKEIAEITRLGRLIR